MRLRVRSKLMLSISIPLIITYVAMLGWDYLQQRQEAIRLTEDLVLGRANLAAGLLDARLAQVQQAAVYASEAIAQRLETTPGRLDLRTQMAAMGALRQYEAAVGLVVALDGPDAPAVVLQRPQMPTRPGQEPRLAMDLKVNLSEAPWYEQVREAGRGRWFSSAEVAGIFPRPTIAYSTPIVVEGQFRGVVSLHVNPMVFRFVGMPRAPRFGRAATQPALSTPTTQETGASPFDLHLDHYLIASDSGEIVYHSPEGIASPTAIKDPAFDGFRPALVAALGSARSGQGDVVAVRDLTAPIFDMQQGKDYWVATVPIRSGQWVFISTYPEARFMDEVRSHLLRRAAFLTAGLCFLLAIVLYASRKISRPLEELEHSTRALGAGHLDVAVPVPEGQDEVAELSRVFNAMLHRLRAQVQQIREESEARARVESELELARQIQTSLLPREMPSGTEDARFAIHACNLPASHVAGDFYDFFVDSTGRLMLVIADVAGHGMPAALLMAVTRTLIRNLAASGMPPAEIALHTNRSLLDNGTEGMFVTLVLCIYDPHTGELTYTNAGHPEPVVLRNSGQVEPTSGSTAPLLGAYSFCEEQCTQRTIQLQPGDTLVLHTDGIFEARPTPQAEEFGEQRLQGALAAEAGKPLAAVCQRVVEAVQAYQQGPLQDDVTLLLLRRL